MPEQPPPSVATIISTDQTANISFVGPLVGWLLAAVVSLIPGAGGILTGGPSGQGPGLLFLAIFATVVGWGISAWRISNVRNLFVRGVVVGGQVTDVRRYRSGMSIEYAFHLHNHAYKDTYSVTQRDANQTIRPGDLICVVVDPDRPTSSLIQDVYP